MSESISVRMDSERRLAVPEEARQELGIEPGDLFLLEWEGSVLRFARADHPLDALAEWAREEYHAGQTRNLRDITREHGIAMNGE